MAGVSASLGGFGSKEIRCRSTIKGSIISLVRPGSWADPGRELALFIVTSAGATVATVSTHVALRRPLVAGHGVQRLCEWVPDAAEVVPEAGEAVARAGVSLEGVAAALGGRHTPHTPHTPHRHG